MRGEGEGGRGRGEGGEGEERGREGEREGEGEGEGRGEREGGEVENCLSCCHVTYCFTLASSSSLLHNQRRRADLPRPLPTPPGSPSSAVSEGGAREMEEAVRTIKVSYSIFEMRYNPCWCSHDDIWVFQCHHPNSHNHMYHRYQYGTYQGFIQDFFLEGEVFFIHVPPALNAQQLYPHGSHAATLHNMSYAISCYFFKTWRGETFPGG